MHLSPLSTHHDKISLKGRRTSTKPKTPNKGN